MQHNSWVVTPQPKPGRRDDYEPAHLAQCAQILGIKPSEVQRLSRVVGGPAARAPSGKGARERRRKLARHLGISPAELSAIRRVLAHPSTRVNLNLSTPAMRALNVEEARRADSPRIHPDSSFRRLDALTWMMKPSARSKPNLRGVDLSGESLQGVALSKQSVSGLRLRRADLGQANLRRTRLLSVDLSEANLREADLTGARLIQSTLRSACLERCKAAGAVFSHVSLGHANLRASDLDGVKFINWDCRLNSADLTGAIMTGVLLQECVLDGILLTPEQRSTIMIRDRLTNRARPTSDTTELPAPCLNCGAVNGLGCHVCAGYGW